jgi:hypothetical protein
MTEGEESASTTRLYTRTLAAPTTKRLDAADTPTSKPSTVVASPLLRLAAPAAASAVAGTPAGVMSPRLVALRNEGAHGRKADGGRARSVSLNEVRTCCARVCARV